MNKLPYQRWVALGLLAFVVILFVFVVIQPLFSMGLDYYEQKNDLLFRLQRQQSIAARKDSVAKNLEDIKQQFQQQGYFTNRSTEALASADLQEIVKTAVTDAGGQLTSTQGLPSKLDNGFNRIAVRVRMTASIDTLRSVLNTFASTVPVLVVDQLDITPIRGVGGLRTRPNGNAKVDSNSQLNVSFQVVSFMRSVRP
jgi:general secretion pathway protein M